MWQPTATLPRVGGYTFAEDPTQTCASVLPIWSADVNPRVLAVRTVPPHLNHQGQQFDVHGANARILQGADVQHLLILRDADIVRLDIIEGTAAAGPVTFSFDLIAGQHLEAQLDAIRALHGAPAPCRSHARLAVKLAALQAIDMRAAGGSLREIADILLGPGDWPGDGEYRKSQVRRLLASGSRMVRCGPRPALAQRYP